jgi:hypothetical protein
MIGQRNENEKMFMYLNQRQKPPFCVVFTSFFYTDLSEKLHFCGVMLFQEQ